jgi:hypothetical protein
MLYPDLTSDVEIHSISVPERRKEATDFKIGSVSGVENELAHSSDGELEGVRALGFVVSPRQTPLHPKTTRTSFG